MANVHNFSAPTKLLLLPDEEPVTCYRLLIAPDVPTGLWTRQLLETTDQYVVRIIQRINDVKGRRCDSCLVQCGGGYDLLVLLNDAPIPPDVSAIPKIGVALCLSTELPPPEDPVSQFGVIGPNEVLHLHCVVSVQAGAFGGNFRIYLQTNTDGSIYQEEQVEKKRVLRIRMERPDSWRVRRVDIEEALPGVFAFRPKVGGASLGVGETEKATVSDSTNVPSKESATPRKKKTNVPSKSKAADAKKKPTEGSTKKQPASNTLNSAEGTVKVKPTPTSTKAKESSAKKPSVPVTKRPTEVVVKDSVPIIKAPTEESTKKQIAPITKKAADAKKKPTEGSTKKQPASNTLNSAEGSVKVKPTQTSTKAKESSAKKPSVPVTKRPTEVVVKDSVPITKAPTVESTKKQIAPTTPTPTEESTKKQNAPTTRKPTEENTKKQPVTALKNSKEDKAKEQTNPNTKKRSDAGETEESTSNTYEFNPTESRILKKALKEALTDKVVEANRSSYSQDEFESADLLLKLMNVDSEPEKPPAATKAKTAHQAGDQAPEKPPAAKKAKTAHKAGDQASTKEATSSTRKSPGATPEKPPAAKKAKTAHKAGDQASTKEATSSTRKSPRESPAKKKATADAVKAPVSPAKKTATADAVKAPVFKNEPISSKRKDCFYFPFCNLTTDACGGTQRGRCREVNSGRVTVPDLDRKQFLAAKREAKIKMMVGKGTPCFYYPFCTYTTKDCGGTQRGRCNEVKQGFVKIPSEEEFQIAKKLARNSLRSTRPEPAQHEEEQGEVVSV